MSDPVRLHSSENAPEPPQSASGGGDDGDNSAAIINLRIAVSQLTTEIANLKENMASKADLQKSINELQKWLIGTIIASVGLALIIAKFFQ